MRRIMVPLYLIIPSVLVSLGDYILSTRGDRSIIIYLIFLYLITLIGIALFFKFHLSGFWALLLGLLMSPLYIAISEYRNRLGLPPYLYDFGLPYVGTTISIIYYVLPFTLLSIILFAIFNGRKNTRTK